MNGRPANYSTASLALETNNKLEKMSDGVHVRLNGKLMRESEARSRMLDQLYKMKNPIRVVEASDSSW